MGKRIRALRKVVDLTQKEAAKIAGISQPSWSDLESGDTKAAEMKAATLLGVARALKSTPEYVLLGHGPPMALMAMTDDEITLLSTYRDLSNKVDQGKIIGFVQALAIRQPQRTASAPFPLSTPATVHEPARAYVDGGKRR